MGRDGNSEGITVRQWYFQARLAAICSSDQPSSLAGEVGCFATNLAKRRFLVARVSPRAGQLRPSQEDRVAVGSPVVRVVVIVFGMFLLLR